MKARCRCRLPSRARRAARRYLDEERSTTPSVPAAARERLAPHYQAGPRMSLSAESQREEPGGSIGSRGKPGPQKESDLLVPVAVPQVQGKGQPQHVTAYNQTLKLEGRTDANFNGGRFRTANVRVTRATGCEGCSEDQCVQVRGTLIATYSVTTTVTLPRVSDFPDLTPCQRRRVQHAIDNVLAPHEQQHVAAFRTYNGTTHQPFDLTLCRSEFDARIREMFIAEEQTRRNAAQAASDALDPFHFDVDLDCKERSVSSGMKDDSHATTPAEAAEEPMG